MLSRVADCLFWMSRYIERAENNARILDVNLQLMLDFETQSETDVRRHWAPIINSLEEQELFHTFYEQANADEWSKVGGSCTLDVCEGFSITFAHSGARHQARAQISLEVGPKGASHVAQWFEALRNIPESDTAGMEEVTKTYLRKPEVRGGTKKT